MQNAVYINKGTTQDDRLPELLLPENVQIDGRDSTQLLAFLSDFSRLLNYYSLNANQKLMRDGDWRFFSKHPIFILAKIASADFRKIVARFHLSAEVLGKSTESLVNKTYAMRLLFEIFGDLVDRTNAWSEDYEDMPLLYRQEYLSVLDNTISPLFGKVRAANEYYLKLALVEYPFFDWKKVSATLNPTLWPHLPGQKSVSEELSILEKRTAGANAAATGTNLEASVNTTYDYVLGLVQDFFNALNQLVRQATVFLQKKSTNVAMYVPMLLW